MPDLKTILNNLRKHAQNKDYVFSRLYRTLYNPEFYINTIEPLKNNSKKSLNPEEAENLVQSLRSEKFRPNFISDLKNKKNELVYKPKKEDLVLNNVLVEILEDIYDPIFSDSVHSERKEKNAHTALKTIEREFKNSNFFIIGDLSPIYKEVNVLTLDKILRERTSDEKFIRLINKFIKKGYLKNFDDSKTYSKTLYGNSLANILLSIYLIPFDNYLSKLSKEIDLGSEEKVLSPEYLEQKRYLKNLSKEIDKESSLQNRRELIELYKKEEKKLKWINRYEDLDPNVRKIHYIRYRDSFLIGMIALEKEVKELTVKIKKFIQNFYGVETDDLIIKDSSKNFHFLEYSLKVMTNQFSDMSRPFIKLGVPDKKIEEFILKKGIVKDIDKKPWNSLHRGYLLNNEDYRIVQIYNAELRDMYNYYSLASNVSKKLGEFHHIMEYSCLKTLARKHKSSLVKMKNKYRIGHEWGIVYTKKNGEKRELLFFKGFKKKNYPVMDKNIDLITSKSRDERNPKRKKRRRLV